VVYQDVYDMKYFKVLSVCACAFDRSIFQLPTRIGWKMAVEAAANRLEALVIFFFLNLQFFR
jgi:hypothetical protein